MPRFAGARDAEAPLHRREDTCARRHSRVRVRVRVHVLETQMPRFLSSFPPSLSLAVFSLSSPSPLFLYLRPFLSFPLSLYLSLSCSFSLSSLLLPPPSLSPVFWRRAASRCPACPYPHAPEREGRRGTGRGGGGRMRAIRGRERVREIRGRERVRERDGRERGGGRVDEGDTRERRE